VTGEDRSGAGTPEPSRKTDRSGAATPAPSRKTDRSGAGTPAPSRKTRLATRVVHAGLEPDPSFGSVIPPIHQTSTYVQPSPGEFVEDYDYARSANPTRAALERAIGELEGGLGSSFSSGMAATHALITAHCSAGDHVVLPSDLYGGTYRLVDKVLKRFGVEYDLVDQTDLAALEGAVRDDTRLIWVETPTNPLLNVVDVGEVVARKRGAIVAVDNTFATPIVQRPLELGADAVVHSATKYLGGHSDVVGGLVVVRDEELHEGVRFVQNAIGAVPGPFDCFLVHRGLRTLHLRVAAHTENGRAVSKFLRGADGVEDVRWPGFGGMVSFRHPDATRIAAATEIFSLAESLGGVESLIEVPQAMTHQSVEDSAAAVPPDLVRLSCGVEAAEDLVEDLSRALSGGLTP
jgi:cystathionine gamma-synthase